MKTVRVAMLFAATGLMLAGCKAAPEIPFDPATAGPIHTIGLVTPGFPKTSSVILASTVGQSFGVVGALVDAGLQNAREGKFAKLLADQHFSPKDEFQQRLASTLAKAGYAVTDLPIKRQHDDDYEKQYPRGAPVDAILDIAVTEDGYLAAGIGDSTPFRPTFSVKAKLVRQSDGSILMQDIVVYNPLNAPPGTITIAPDPNFAFVDVDALVADPPQTVLGLRGAIDQTVDSLVNLLK